MALRYKYETREEIPAEVATHYREHNGAFVLDADAVDAAEYNAAQTELTQARNRIEALAITNVCATAGARRGLRPAAAADLAARAREALCVIDGKPAVRAADGKGVAVHADGKTPVTVEEWIEQQVDAAPHLFDLNQGANALGGGGAATTDNPFDPAKENYSAQAALIKSNPEKATRLAAMHGIKI